MTHEPIVYAKLILKQSETIFGRTVSDFDGNYTLSNIPPGQYLLVAQSFEYPMDSLLITIPPGQSLYQANMYLDPSVVKLEEVQIVAHAPARQDLQSISVQEISLSPQRFSSSGVRSNRTKLRQEYGSLPVRNVEQPSSEEFGHRNENGFRSVKKNPLSTFSIDVDRASYAIIRKKIREGNLPPVDAVRIEEMINYFEYDYPAPQADLPFALHTEFAVCPWNESHGLVRVALKAKEIDLSSSPANNLVFLIDVSGSMSSPDKLPLLKKGLYLLVDQLREEDRVAIVVYAGAAGLVLPSTSGNRKDQIKSVIEQLEAGGSTAGGAGIELAYKVALESFLEGGNNRVILATDGDFNVGISSEGDLIRMIEEKRDNGIFLSCLGLGLGNLKDYKIELLADKGNGNYNYIDDLDEARKVLVSEMGGTLITVAKDVKIQAEFNPQHVSAYRLIGYENRLLNDEDFDNDAKDAGELGAGHTVTALYEIIPAGSEEYQDSSSLHFQEPTTPKHAFTDQLMHVKLRYKEPAGRKSMLVENPVPTTAVNFKESSDDFRFAVSVAAFGMLLRQSEFNGSMEFGQIVEWAKSAKGADAKGYRQDFIELVEQAAVLSHTTSSE
jgi:Ca-activated chloride channel family protein